MNIRAEGLEHELRMVSGASRLRHRRLSVRVKTRKQDGGFYLRRSDRRIVVNAVQLSALDQKRHTAVVVFALDIGTHQGKRLDHPSHRTLPDRSIAVDLG